MRLAPDLSAWNLPTPANARHPDGGTNNLVRLIDDTYVLRVNQPPSPSQPTP